ncbi:unnamed protein product [Cyclocybe aegerita]|uniref:Uncharacterized protein n=1 Tax=Cyclocybe aegerita TaxID=1973307 RepID=A0A8S0WTN9_CYCAE|nr:unnamed protein product [Cyclocybe aegerita]
MPLLASPFPPNAPIPMPLGSLRSPIHLADSCAASAPPPTCVLSSRRRPKTGSSTLRGRRRLSQRDPYPPPQPHAFDSLPWISTLEAAPDLLNPRSWAHPPAQVSDPIKSHLLSIRITSTHSRHLPPIVPICINTSIPLYPISRTIPEPHASSLL